MGGEQEEVNGGGAFAMTFTQSGFMAPAGPALKHLLCTSRTPPMHHPTTEFLSPVPVLELILITLIILDICFIV